VAIIPGPKEPKNIAPYFKLITEEFQKYGLQGLTVVDSHSKREFQHRPFLAAVYGDSIGLKKLQAWLSHSAYLGCGYCELRGVYRGHAMRWLGYKEPVPYGTDLVFDEGTQSYQRMTTAHERKHKIWTGDHGR
jgi:hypothetical protein